MKKEIIDKLSDYKRKLKSLKKDISALSIEIVRKKKLRNRADEIASMWVEELRSPLEHKFKIDKIIIEENAGFMKHLHILSRPNNQKSSYLKVISATLKNFNDKFILPIKQMTFQIDEILDLYKIIPNLHTEEESNYLKEAINCANSGYFRASIVMGWCAIIDRIQKIILSIGLNKFNIVSTTLKSQTKGKFKKWNKEFSISIYAELQEIFDKDLITILEGMNLIDSNQAERLRTCFEYRNHSAHPGEAPIEEANIIAFFSDINKIILQNPKFQL